MLAVTTVRKSTINKTACLRTNRTKSKKSMRRVSRSLRSKAVNNRSKMTASLQNKR